MSFWVSANKIPSVITLIDVCLEVLSVNLTLKPTKSPRVVLSSSEILVATERAAILRGCVWPIIFFWPRPRAKQIFGN